MRKYLNNLNVIIILIVFFSSEMSFAQLGFCQGNSGDSIFEENFGTGLVDTPLPNGTTTYNYANGGEPLDGLYTVSSNTNYFDWFVVEDHTPGDIDGRMLVVNSDFAAGEFYRAAIDGLCENTTYEFSSWINNLTPAGGFCGAGVIPVNVRFEIWDSTDTNLLTSGNTGSINSTNTPIWQQFALVFQTVPMQTSVILKMINNGSGGCGNDLAIDDIVFKSCGDNIVVTDSSNSDNVSICSSQLPFSTTLTAIPDNTVFNNHFYQWQESADTIIWTDLIGETNDLITITGVTDTMYYRAKVAEFEANINNDDCITFSDVYSITVFQVSAPPTIECWETVTLDSNICDWVITGTQPPAPTGLQCWETATFNDISCSWEISGAQPLEPSGLECWQTSTFNSTICDWEVTGTQPIEPELECWETATFNDISCSWEISGAQPLEPFGLECWQTSTFNSTICDWEVTGTQPIEPELECWETATFNDISCSWEISGAQPLEPSGLECWQTSTFNSTICDWEVTGTQPAEPTGLECWETTAFNTTTCMWEVSGIQPTEPTGLECWESTTFNVNTCTWEISGTQPEAPTDLECWEIATFSSTLCVWEISGTQIIDIIDEFITICEGEDVFLQANTEINNATYQWNSGETEASISVNTAGIYSVVTTDGCSTIEKTFFVESLETPVIESVQSDGNDIIILTSNSGDFEYSIDGVTFQSSSVFYDIDGGKYTIYVKSIDCDTTVTVSFLHFYIPKFFTPNNDGHNDFFSLTGIDCFESSQVYIFDRYGKLLFSTKNNVVNWEGTFNDNPLPTSDYWYLIIIEGQEFKGHFTLKR